MLWVTLGIILGGRIGYVLFYNLPHFVEHPIEIIKLWNGVPLVVTPPPHIELKVIETDPGVRGDTATGGSKPAKMETGAMVRVPLFINEGEVLRIDTRTGEYISRGKGE